jgi:hypothetical protein
MFDCFFFCKIFPRSKMPDLVIDEASVWFPCLIFHAIVLANRLYAQYDSENTHDGSASTGTLPHVLDVALLRAFMDTTAKKSRQAPAQMAK